MKGRTRRKKLPIAPPAPPAPDVFLKSSSIDPTNEAPGVGNDTIVDISSLATNKKAEKNPIHLLQEKENLRC
jgi:hypothetical protein